MRLPHQTNSFLFWFFALKFLSSQFFHSGIFYPIQQIATQRKQRLYNKFFRHPRCRILFLQPFLDELFQLLSLQFLTNRYLGSKCLMFYVIEILRMPLLLVQNTIENLEVGHLNEFVALQRSCNFWRCFSCGWYSYSTQNHYSTLSSLSACQMRIAEASKKLLGVLLAGSCPAIPGLLKFKKIGFNLLSLNFFLQSFFNSPMSKKCD